MPRENKKRGKRGNKKRKHDGAVGDDQGSPKRTRFGHDERDQLGDDFDLDIDRLAANRDYQPLDQDDPATYDAPAAEHVFFGMLDEEEQEFFKTVDQRLELDDFEGPADRALFLDSVYKEADGKELKLACSQSCSRVLERLIHLATVSQLGKLFQKFNGNFMHLVQHRFASHCCEKLFIKAAPHVSHELKQNHGSGLSAPNGDDEVYVSLEDLFLHTVAELKTNIGFLITDRFGSHALRVLLLVLAGEPLTSPSQKSLLHSKRKENVVVDKTADEGDIRLDKSRPVPKSFFDALEDILNSCATGLHTAGLRTLSTNPLGNPILQVLVKLELVHFGKQRAKDPKSILRTLLPEDEVTQETESASFINGLNYDPVGSHLLETIIESSPGKLFKHLYKEFWKTRMASLSRNEVAAYVVCKILDRLGRDDLIEAHDLILPEIPNLIERNRIVVVKTLIQRCAVRNVDTQAMATALHAYYRDAEDGFDMLKLLRLESSELEDLYKKRPRVRPPPEGALTARQTASVEPSSSAAHEPKPKRPMATQDPARVQGSVLAQTMITVAGPLSNLIFDAMARLSPTILIAMASDPVACRTVQATMTSTNASIIPRRKLVQQFYGHIGEMALQPSASHVVDAIWEGTHGLAFIRERIAEELAENEAQLRESPYGRAIWKNWKMDLYNRRRAEWVTQSRDKARNDGFQSFEELDLNKKKMESTAPGALSSSNASGENVTDRHDVSEAKQKTPLELARERHYQRKKQSQDRRGRTSTIHSSNTATAAAGAITGENSTSNGTSGAAAGSSAAAAATI